MSKKKERLYEYAEELIEAAAEEGFIPKERVPEIKRALTEVELMERGELPKKSARVFKRNAGSKKINKYIKV